MMRKKITAFLLFLFLFLSLNSTAQAAISNINISPDLDISYFDNYVFSANIDPQPETASITLEGINGEGGSDYIYYADGTTFSHTLNFDLSFDSGTTWKKTYIRPDHIYPTILFANPHIAWDYSPLDLNVWRNNYQLLHFQNPFTPVNDMSFWIEINTTPISTRNSADMQVYLVKNAKSINFFQSDWRESNDVEEIGVINRNTVYHHTHTDNSSHHLIRLTANADGTFGNNNIDISNDFWIIIYNKSPNTNKGWNLKYHPSSICTNTNGWYIGQQNGWTTTAQSGCPDAHVHIARRSTYADGIKATITAGEETSFQDFSFAVLPNLAPNTTDFTNPVTGVYDGTVNITWNAATDPNEDIITYNLYLLDSNDQVSQTLITDTSSTNFSWDTTDGETDGNYSLKGESCDPSAACTAFYSESFSLNNAATTIKSLTSITNFSNNTNTNLAEVGDIVTLSFSADGEINTPNVNFYSGGIATTNTANISNPNSNNWIATYVVDENDTSGLVTFTISAEDLDLEYSDITSGNYVTVNIPEPEIVVIEENDNSDESSSPSAPTCSDKTPISIPDLFQININNRQAVVYYAPINEDTTDYYISYGESADNMQHGAFTGLNDKDGVMAFQINHLKPNTTYYFKIRAQNGCAPGFFGDVMSAKTKKWYQLSKTANYKYGNVLNKIIIDNSITNIAQQETTEKNQKKESENETQVTITEKQEKTHEEIKTENKKEKEQWCFLWWCFDKK